ncbi:acyl-CoA dehydrogenase family protein [Tepidiforma sp.]|uniref:acyl-CoA dehydrogenase family protein n=1 Tax=Tepidiforma sp. TaxID=2682230 RepID=UPI002ADDBD59|nr:acyl-CoA dehydrogenase family protein [Tepidiforma sp.]
MDFRDTPEEAAFRAEVRKFIAEEGHKARQRDDDGERGFFGGSKEWTKALAARRWIAPAWPKEYGGAGLSVMEQFIFNWELAEARLPRPGGIAVGFAGPTLIVHGTEEQKKKYLPGILSGEDIWCQGYSEPGAGSDLASLQTRAVRDGDDYIINGQKIWTSGGHLAKWMILLARTDPDAPKHRGITYFIVDMKSPGVTVRPLINAAYTHEFNEVFFEDVRVPRENIIGEENRGWYLAQTTLSFERSNIGGSVGARQAVEDLIKFARENTTNGQSTLAHNPAIRHELVERYVEAGVAQMMSFKIVSIQAKEGVAPGHEAAVAKLYGTELNQRIYRTGMKVLGLYGQLDAKTAGPTPPMRGRIKYMYLRSIANTIEGGTSEIQRNIIATRGLGLPRA